MKKKSLKSLSLKKSNIATISGGLQDGQANEPLQALSAGCPLSTIILTIHSNNPMVCETQCCVSRCKSWCVDC